MLYKKLHQFDEKKYIIEISKSITDPNKQSVIAYSLLGDRNYYLSLPITIYGDVSTNVELLAKNLQLKRKQLNLSLYWRSKSILRSNKRNKFIKINSTINKPNQCKN